MRTRRTLAAAGLLLVLGACDDAQFVDRVVVVNETDYPANVEVRGESGGWLGLTTVTADSTSEVREVIDQGDAWTFRFSYGGYDPVEASLTKRELMDADWRVELPAEF